MKTVRMYYWLTKPGIVYGNVVSTIAGFFLASSLTGALDLGLFLAVISGTGLVIASACVVNNIGDRAIDRKMKRTEKRATAANKISGQSAALYAALLAVAGFGILVAFTNWRTALLGLLAYLAYTVLYAYVKRKSTYGTLAGSISGSLPLVAGYVAVVDRFDLGALLLFLVMAAWQMPHFYAIAMRRHDDYKAAGIPVLPVVKGMNTTKKHIMAYICLFVIVNVLLAIYGLVGHTYVIVMSVLGGLWLGKGAKGFSTDNDTDWARKMFLFSLVVLISMCVMLSVGGLLP